MPGRAAANSEDKNLVDRIRGFQRSCQANKKCADCIERGPTYICLDFQTFICQTCSGIHREFGHKIRSISLSQWTTAEVEELEAGGNALAAKKWLSSWSKEEFPEPDNSMSEKVREFLHMKYVEKRWLLKEPERPPGEKLEEKPQAAAVVAPAAAPDKPLQPKAPAPAGFNDLLSDTLPEAAPVRPLTQCIMPPPAASPIVSSMEWMADFSNDTNNIDMQKTPPAGKDCGGLGDLDASLFAEPHRSTLGHGIADVTDFALMGAPTDALMKEPPLAEPHEEPAPAQAEADKNNLGDQMRSAIMSGRSEDLMRLFKVCEEKPEVPKKAAVPAERLEVYAAFDDLGDFGKTAVPLAPQPLPTNLWQAAGGPTNGFTAGSSPPPGDPFNQIAAVQRDIPPAQLPWAESGQILPGQLSIQSPAGTATPQLVSPPSATLTPRQLVEMMPQGSNVLTPQQLEQLNPQQLMHMQLMISQALKQACHQQQVPSAAAPSCAPPSCTPGAFGQQLPHAALSTKVVDWEPERLPGPPKQFDDLLAAFQEKNPIAGLDFSA